MKPTEICFLSECNEENWRRSWIREPLPNELLIEAWKARVGQSLDNVATHRAYYNWNHSELSCSLFSLHRGSYRRPGWHQITLVQDKDQMLVRLFLANEVFHVLATSSHRVTGVQHMNDDIRRINHLVQFVPDTLRLTRL